jgi:hypothetical protein
MSITETTRRNITDFLRLERIQWHGRMEEIQFLQRIFNLSSLPSNDGRHKDAEGDIWRHRVLNPEDWEDDWIYGDSRFNLLYCSDDIFLNFLCEMIHPLVRPESDEVERLLKFFNENLANDGWKIVETMRLGGKPIFSARQAISFPVATLEVVTNALNTDYLMQQVTRMQSEIDADPTLAIGTAKEFVETICKTILNVRGVSYDKNLEIQPLVKLTCKTLKLVREDIPDETKAADTVRNLLSNLAVISQYLAELRNPYGTGHGKEASFKGLQPRHARLAVSAATTLGVFLFETYAEQQTTS